MNKSNNDRIIEQVEQIENFKALIASDRDDINREQIRHAMLLLIIDLYASQHDAIYKLAQDSKSQDDAIQKIIKKIA